MFAKLADLIMKHSKAIIVLWMVVLICALPLGLHADEKMEYDLTKMVGTDSESGKGQTILDEYFSNSVSMEEIIVIKYDDADTSLNKANTSVLLGDLSSRLAGEYDGKLHLEVVGYYSGDGHTTGVFLVSVCSDDDDFSILNETGNIRSLLSESKKATGFGYETFVTGNDAITYDTMESSEADMAKIDPISIFLILILLGLFFYAVCTAVVPPLGVGVAYGISLLAMYMIGCFTGVYYLTKTLVLVTMLGAGCDYGIFIVTRYREELKKGADHDSALRSAIEWAGESVFTSGLAVIIGFGCLAICDFTMVRSMGIVLACGIVLALVVALTLIPAVVNLLGGRIFWPTKVSSYEAIEKGEGRGFYARLCYISKGYFDFVARFTRRFAVPIVIVAILICVPALHVYTNSSESYDMISVNPDSESKDGLNAIMEETYGGTLMPTYIVMELNSPAAAAIGGLNMGGSMVYFVKWTPEALSIAADGTPSGYVPAIMRMSSAVSSEYGNIVAASSSLNSWYCLYASAYSVAAQAVSDAVVAQYRKGIIENYLSMGITPTEEQIAAGLAAQSSAIQAAVTYQISVNVTPDVINHAIYSKLGSVSTSVQAAVGKVLTVCSGSDVWNILPDATIAPGLQLMNVLDGILNINTGLLNVDESDMEVIAAGGVFVPSPAQTTHTGRYASMMIVTNERPMSDNTMSFVEDLQKRLHGDSGLDSDMSSVYSRSYVTGTSASMDDISSTVSKQFKTIEVIVVVLLVILLFAILRCYLTPIRAIANILMSVVWTIALTHFVFGTMLSTPVCWIVPIVLFVVLLGLGMDYDIFLTTRVREYKIKGYSNHDAVMMAVRNAGSTITLCALIMGGTFLSLLVANSSMLREFGFALGVGILIDGLFMVTYVVPALMHILGEASWAGPRFAKRPVRLGRGFTASQGFLAAALMVVFGSAAWALSGGAFDTVAMTDLVNFDDRSRVYVQIAFGIGGLVLLAFGAFMVRTGIDLLAKLSGAAYAVSAVLMIIASFATVNGVEPSHLWGTAFAAGVAASAVYAVFAGRRHHMAYAGSILVLLFAFVGGALAGGMTVTFGLAIAVSLSVFVTALCEYSESR